MVLKRLVLMLFNIFFPPITVCLLAGPNEDLLINCLLFLCGVIPSHVHCFYISSTYFHRKRKVRKGRYPGVWKSLIYSERVQNGGASNREVEVLRRTERAGEIETVDKRRKSHSGYGYGDEKSSSPVSQRSKSRGGYGYGEEEPSSPISQRSKSRGGYGYGEEEPSSPISQRRKSGSYGKAYTRERDMYASRTRSRQRAGC